MISKQRILLTAGLAVALAAAAVAYMTKSNTRQSASMIQQSWPPPFNALQIGSTQQDVLAKVGKPESQAANRLFENKSAKDWIEIEAQADELAQRAQDPYVTMPAADNARLLTLSRTLAHRTKSLWSYPKATGTKDKVVLAFDGDGKLLRLDVTHQPHLAGGPPPAKPH